MSERDEMIERAKAFYDDWFKSGKRLWRPETINPAVDFALAETADLRRQLEWVPVSERLPEAKKDFEHSEQVLVWYQPTASAVGNYGIAYYPYNSPYQGTKWIDFGHLGREPIYWRPLPPKPDDVPKRHYDPQQRRFTRCQSDDDGDCEWSECPQLKDGEPKASGRHCPLDIDEEIK